MHAAFIVSRVFDDTRAVLRAAASRPGVGLSLIKGQADVEAVLGVLRSADAIWFEGMGPLLGRLASRPSARWLPRAYLRIGEDDTDRLPAAQGWGMVAEVIVGSTEAAGRLKGVVPAAEGAPVRVRVARGVGELLAVLATPAGDLPVGAWSAIMQIGQACRGRVLIRGDAPAELAEYLTVACGLDVVAGGLADCTVFWEDRGGPLAPLCRVERAVGRDGARAADGPPVRPGDPAAGGPLVSAVVPVYNGADTIDRCLRSLVRQTYPNLEILVIDDGSTDETARVVEKHLNDPRVRYLYKAHSGRPETRNLGVAEARGDYIAWLDADDVAMPNRIRAQVEAADRAGGADVVHADGFLVAAEGELRSRRRNRDFRAEELPALLMAGFGSICPILNTSAMVRRALYDRVGYYDTSLARCQDYDFFCRCAMEGGVRFAHVPVPLVKVYRSPPSPQTLRAILDNYHLLGRRLIEHFGVEGLADPVARDLHEPDAMAIARMLLATGVAFRAPDEHAIWADAEEHLKVASKEATGRAREEVERLLEMVPRRHAGADGPTAALRPPDPAAAHGAAARW
ncbi:MAG: hypothetical protein AMK72_03905 [Planctomycetes bacterium SM23_25]|nr:MAG: hypothetical protein AMK72_03905 [Planctomycetes bacterium SM23_25]